EHMIGLLRDRDPPLDPGAADAEVLEPLSDHRQHFVLAALRTNPELVRDDLLPQPARIGRETEEEVLLLGPLAGPFVDRAEVAGLLQLVVVLEFLAARTVPARVLAAIHGGLVVGRGRGAQEPPEPQDALDMQLIGGPDEAVVRDVQARPEPLP